MSANVGDRKPVLEIVVSASSPAELWPAGVADSSIQSPTSLGMRLFDRWRETIKSRDSDDDQIRQRLEWLHLTEATIPLWLSAPEHFQVETIPPWAEFLGDVLAPENFQKPNAHSPGVAAIDTTSCGLPLFPILSEPFISAVEDRISRNYPRLGDDLTPAAKSDIAAYVTRRWSNLAARTLAKEIRQQARFGKLRGSTSADRYRSFVESFREAAGSYWDLYRRFPVLARLQAVCCLQIVEHLSELLTRFDADRNEISRFLGEDLSCVPIRRLHLGLSDPHAGGRTVVRLEFESGKNIIYKPRSMSLDVSFASILDRWNLRHPDLPLKVARVLDRPDYGWVEFIKSRDCANLRQVEDYFRRQGAYAALFYLLGSMDFHQENFVPAGDSPVPIDLEALLNPRRAADSGFNALPAADSPSALDTCLTTGMLPSWHAADGDRVSHQISGIGGTGTRGFPAPRLIWEGLETDELRQRWIPGGVEDHHVSLPRFEGRPVLAGRHLTAIVEGFDRMYRDIVDHREELFEQDGLIKHLQQAGVRVLARNTREYIDLLSLATAPEHLISGAAYDLALELLCVNPIPFEMDFRIVDSEKQALWQRDVPYFFSPADAVHLHDSAGTDLGPVFSLSGCDVLSHRLRTAGEDDLNWQLQVLKASLRMACDDLPPIRLKEQSHTAHSTANEGDRLLAAAVEIGEAVELLSLRSAQGASWLSLRPASTGPHLDFHRIDPWVYDGGAGVAIFLANLFEATESESFARLASEALQFAVSSSEHEHAEAERADDIHSSYAGPPSLAFALLECGLRLKRDDLLELGWSQLRQCVSAAKVEWKNPDLMHGAAGLIAVLLRYHQAFPQDWLLDEAVRLGELLNRWPERRLKSGGFCTPWNDRPLTGMAHGQAGIALALARLGRLTGIPWARALIDELLAYETSQFANDLQDWLDLRVEERDIMPSWCAGAPGIGMSRLGMLRVGVDDPQVKTSLQQALAATDRHLGDSLQSLCCGESGRVWLLSEAGRQLGRPELISQARRAAITMVDTAAARGYWHLAVREPNTLPGLMTGISGIGLSLLQVRNPSAVTRILTLG